MNEVISTRIKNMLATDGAGLHCIRSAEVQAPNIVADLELDEKLTGAIEYAYRCGYRAGALHEQLKQTKP